MLSVVKVRNAKSVDIVYTSDGGKFNAPKNVFHWGQSVNKSDLVKTGDYSMSHKSLIPAPVQKPKKEAELCRDLTGYDPKEELDMIRGNVRLLFYEVMGREPWYSDEIDELVADFAYKFQRRQVYQKFDPSYISPNAYKGYVKTTVYRMMLDYLRKLNTQILARSLHHTIGDDCEVIDTVSDVSCVDIPTDLVRREEAEAIRKVGYAVALEMDTKDADGNGSIGTGLDGFTFKGIFETLIEDKPMDEFLASFKYPKDLLNQYVYNFRSELHEAFLDAGFHDSAKASGY